MLTGVVAPLRGLIMKLLMPQFQAQQPPTLARKTCLMSEITQHRLGIDVRAMLSRHRIEGIKHELLQLKVKPLLKRHRETHFVATVENFSRNI